MSLLTITRTAMLAGALAILTACASEDTAPPMHTAPTVSVAPVIHQQLTEWDEFTGRLQAPESVELRPRVSGYIVKVAFEEGSLVKTGEPLFQIDDRPFKAEVARLQAELESARSQQRLAESEYNRVKRLSVKKAVSEDTLDNRLAQMQQAEATVHSVTAALQLAKLNLEYTSVTAPIDGRVSNASVTQGNYVSAGQSLLTSIVSTDKVYAYFDADEQTYLKYARLAREGSRPSARDASQPVFMALANDNGYPHEGVIDFVDNRVDPRTGTIRGRAVFDNRDNLFIPGLFARIKLVGSASYQGILVDDKAIGTDLNSKFVLVVDEANVAQYRSVELGEKVAGLRIIKSGLQPNDMIVVNGLQRVRPGSPVTPEMVEMAPLSTLAKLHKMQRRVDQARLEQRYASQPAVSVAQGG